VHKFPIGSHVCCVGDHIYRNGIVIDYLVDDSFCEVLADPVSNALMLFPIGKVTLIAEPCIEELLLNKNARLRKLGAILYARAKGQEGTTD